MEQKFFEEKMRLQQEANQKIAELAERAHTEAIKNLDETTRDVYKGLVQSFCHGSFTRKKNLLRISTMINMRIRKTFCVSIFQEEA